MNSVLKTFLLVLVTAVIAVIVTYMFVSNKLVCPVNGELNCDENDVSVENNESGEPTLVVPTLAEPNIVKHSDEKHGIYFQFELPEGYGVVKDIVGEGLYQVKYYLGKFDPESGESVISSSVSMGGAYLRVVPSYDPEIVTLDDWEETGNIGKLSDVIDTSEIEIAGMTVPVYHLGGFSEYRVVRFVVDKNYYELFVEGNLEGESVSKLIETLKFRD